MNDTFNSVDFSFIIPCYNVEEYLEECLDSVINQTFTDFEVICINDGSTDGSVKILDEFMQKDRRIKVIHKKNEGVSKARNEGIVKATGKYIMFVDADDWVDEEQYNELINMLGV